VTKIQCYIAQSLDGYIARKDHSIDWLENISVPEGSDLGYGEFYSNIDTVIMGRKTYNEVMGFDVPWPYADAQCYVVTSDKDYLVRTPNTSLVHEVDGAWIDEIKAASNQNIWLIGGGGLVTQFMKLYALDELLITIIPIILGDGIALFPDHPPETQWDLKQVNDFGNGAVMLSYLKKMT
jgi:dihydrofolate reductase